MNENAKIIIDLQKEVETLELLIAQNLKNKAYGELYEDSAGSTITVTVAGTYYGWKAATAGLYNLTTLDVAHVTADNITINAEGAGIYVASFAISYKATANDDVHWAIYKNAAKQPNISNETKISNTNSILNSSSLGLLDLDATDVIDLRVTSSTNGTVITVNHCNLSIFRIK